jgi:plastocyanin
MTHFVTRLVRRLSFTPLFVSAALLACTSCGGDRTDQPADGTPGTPGTDSATMAAMPDTAGVVIVRMTGDGVSSARYEPDRLTIAPGTRVRFVNVSGWPHNIAFWPDSIPSGAASALGSGMPNTIGELQGELLTEPNATYTVTFGDAPPGEYKGYCVPHLALNMRIWITVRG